MSSLPVIDVSPLLIPEGDRASVDDAIGEALTTTAGFVIRGFPGGDRMAELCRTLLRFFDLPQPVRHETLTRRRLGTGSNLYRGLTVLERVKDKDFATVEMFDIGPEPARDTPRIAGAETLTEANLWPSVQPWEGWRAAMLQHHANLSQAALAVMLAAGRAVGLDDRKFAPLFNDHNSTLRLLRYPNTGDPAAAGDDGPALSSQRHTDGAGVSLLWQAEPGLQAEGRDGVWRDIPQLPDSISVHLGDVLEMVTDGAIPATPHRVVQQPGERRSVGFFLEPSLSASLTGSTRPEDTYGWRLLERLRSYPSLQGRIPEPRVLEDAGSGGS